MFRGRPLPCPDDGQPRAVEYEMAALAGRDRWSQTAAQMLTPPGKRRIVGGAEVEAHRSRTGRAGTLRTCAQREMGEEPQASQRSRWRDPSTGHCPPRRPLRRGVQEAIASEDAFTVTSPRRTRPGCRPARSPRDISSCMWDGPSTASRPCGACGGSREVLAKPPHCASGSACEILDELVSRRIVSSLLLL